MILAEDHLCFVASKLIKLLLLVILPVASTILTVFTDPDVVYCWLLMNPFTVGLSSAVHAVN